MQSFDVVAGRLRLLDRPEVCLQQAKAPTKTYIATFAPRGEGSGDPRLLAIEDTGQSRGAESWRPTARGPVYVLDHRDNPDAQDPLSSDSDQLGSEDEPRYPDIDPDAEYLESETLKILAYGMGRAQVR